MAEPPSGGGDIAYRRGSRVGSEGLGRSVPCKLAGSLFMNIKSDDYRCVDCDVCGFLLRVGRLFAVTEEKRKDARDESRSGVL